MTTIAGLAGLHSLLLSHLHHVLSPHDRFLRPKCLPPPPPPPPPTSHPPPHHPPSPPSLIITNTPGSSMFLIGLIYTVAPNSPSAGKCLIAFVFIYSAILAGTL